MGALGLKRRSRLDVDAFSSGIWNCSIRHFGPISYIRWSFSCVSLRDIDVIEHRIEVRTIELIERRGRSTLCRCHLFRHDKVSVRAVLGVLFVLVVA